ncbi:MAG: mucoidy inhibitor MuiA family protein [Bacteroidales bacterium]|nr:mucoidy inhibitor MuiA family protein [Bacteroidales bacterium]
MRRAAIFTLLFPFVIGTTFAQQKHIKSKVVSATVYTQGAQITRVAKINLDKGENRVIFTNLPPNLDESSIQISCVEATIVSVSCQKNMLDSLSQNPEFIKLQARKKELEKKITLEKALLQTIDLEKDVLASNKKLIGDQGVKLEDLKNSLIYFRARFDELERSRIEKLDLIANLEEDLRKLNEQIQNLSAQKVMNTSEIMVAFMADQPISTSAKIKYFAIEAGWYPTYDIRVNSINAPLSITNKANVYQTTGEDWSKIKLSVSSGNPTSGSTAPTIFPWYIDIIQPYLNYSVRGNAAVAKKEKVFEEAEVSMSSKDDAMVDKSMPVSVSESQTNFTFNIDIPYDIPSKQQPVTAILQTPTVKATYQYTTTPKLSEYAYLIANMTEWQGLNLLYGDANLYFENNFVGSTTLNTKAFGDTLKLSLGKDESVAVKRTKVKAFKEKNLIGSKVTETRSWEITITNGKKQDVEIEIEDQVPVSANEKVKVKLLDQGGANYNSANGLLKWILIIKSQETKKLQFSYSVEYPKENQISLE